MSQTQGGLDIRVDQQGTVVDAQRRGVPFDELPVEEQARLVAGKALTMAMGALERIVGGEGTDGDFLALRAAAPLVASWQRLQQSRGALRALEVQVRALDFSMARAIAEDKEQLRHYLRVTQPALPLVKAMPK